MANQEHLDILKQGVNRWNQWRKENKEVPGFHLADRKVYFIEVDLRGADLSDAYLVGVNLSCADLSGVNFCRANLGGADLGLSNLFGAEFSDAHLVYVNLESTHLRFAHFKGARLDNADLRGTDLPNVNFHGASLSRASLNYANLSNTDLRDADLNEADLSRANLSDVDLSRADLSGAEIAYTVFAGVDLSTARGLEMINHRGPSTIGIDTIIRSRGKIPEIFLRNAGVPDAIIEAIPSLIGSLSPTNYYSCFISYSSKDQAFAERLRADLVSKGVPCWFAPHDMRIGDEIRPRVDESIRAHDKLLLVLSESSLTSTWVKKEVETAFEKESQQNRLVLFPIRLDETVMQTSQAWAADIRRMRHIGDFTHWKDHDAYQIVFARLLRDLQAQ